MRKVTEIILHCSETIEGKNFKAVDIDRWHKENGWKGIGYHYVVDLDGTVEVGRTEAEIGSHCKEHNKNSIGVCYIGGLDKKGKFKDTRTEAQMASLESLLLELKRRYPGATLHGHNEFSDKACPCFSVETDRLKAIFDKG